MDSEMYSEFAGTPKKGLWKKNFSLEEQEEEETRKKDSGSVCEEILQKLTEFLDHVPHMESQFAFHVDKAIRPLVDALKEKAEAEEAEAEETLVLPRVEQLAADVQELKEAMSENESVIESQKPEEELATQKNLDSVVDDVTKMKEEMGAQISAFESELKKMREELETVSSNLGSLFTFIYAKDRGKAARLKGGFNSSGNLVIDVGRPKLQ